MRELQLAKAAIAAATTLLLRENGLRPGDLRAVYLAGAFGNFIRRHQAQRIGLLPVMPPERIRFVGNAALEGARLALLQAESRKAIEGLVRRTRQLDVSSLPDFQDVFSEALPFPDPGAAGPAGPGRSRL